MSERERECVCVCVCVCVSVRVCECAVVRWRRRIWQDHQRTPMNAVNCLRMTSKTGSGGDFIDQVCNYQFIMAVLHGKSPSTGQWEGPDFKSGRRASCQLLGESRTFFLRYLPSQYGKLGHFRVPSESFPLHCSPVILPFHNHTP